MNERIRKLAKQAGFGLHRDGEIYTSRLEHLPITEDIEKLAQLIVRECMNIVENHPIDPEDMPCNMRIIPYMIEVQEKMQLHFGVQE